MYPNVPYGNNALTSRAMDIKTKRSDFGGLSFQSIDFMADQRLRRSSPSVDASSFLAAMYQLNQQHPPDHVATPNYSPLEPGPSLRVPQEPVSEASTPLTSGPVSPSSPSSERDPLVAFHRNLQVRIDALNMLPEAERREKARLQAASRANDVCQLLDRKASLVKMRPYMRPDAYAKHIADLQLATKASYCDYFAHFCLTFRFNDLPMELLTEIFRFIIWPLSPFEADLRVAIRLTHVCRLWRSVVISDKRIWNPVCFGDPQNFDRTFALMERAGPSDIDIRIRDEKEKPLSREAMTQLIDRLFVQLPSIRKLDVFLFSREAVIPILDGLQRIPLFECPMKLEYLEIHSFYSSGVPAEFLPSLPLFGGAFLPSFRHLRLNGVNIKWDVDLLSRLTTLDLRRIAMDLLPSTADFRAVLNGASGLEKMILDGAGPKYEQGGFSLSPIPIPSLRILILGGLSDSYAEYVLSHFTAPNVLDLTIMFPIDNIYKRLVTALSTTSQMAKVKILILVKMPLNGETIPTDSRALLARWLKSMPELAFIRLLQTSSEIFEVLKSERTQAPPANVDEEPRALGLPDPKHLVCPQVIYMDYQNDYDDFDILLAWIIHRRIMGYPLKKVWLAPSTVSKLTEEQKVRVWDALGGLGVPQIVSYRTLEEEAMCKQV